MERTPLTQTTNTPTPGSPHTDLRIAAIALLVCAACGLSGYYLVRPMLRPVSALPGQANATQPSLISTSTISPTKAARVDEKKILAIAMEVIKDLTIRDYRELEMLVSPDGLSLNDHPRFDQSKNLITKSEIATIPKDTRAYLWGYTDGSGDAIKLTRERFLIERIYTNAVGSPDIAINKKLGASTLLNTIEEDIAGRTYVAFHFPGLDPKLRGTDWTTLYLIFDNVQGEYRLRGISKDNSSI